MTSFSESSVNPTEPTNKRVAMQEHPEVTKRQNMAIQAMSMKKQRPQLLFIVPALRLRATKLHHIVKTPLWHVYSLI